MPRVSPKNKSLILDAQFTPLREPPERWESRILKFLLIVLAGLFVYAPAFHGGWLWDDDQEITENAVMRDPSGLVKAWTGATGADYLPLKTTVQWLFFRVAGVNQTAWHLLNVALHLLNALLLWKLLVKLRIRHGWLGGLLFVVHPILVESVAWVSELKNTLSLPFLLLALIAWIDFSERGRAGQFLLTLALFIAAILCKASVIMFPVVLLLHAWWRTLQPEPVAEFQSGFLKTLTDSLQRRFPLGFWRGVVASVPFFLVSLIIGLLTIKFQHDRAIGAETIPVGGLLSRTEIAGVSMWFYLFKSLLPTGLLPIYPRWEPQPVMLLAWPAMAGLLFWFWTRRKTWGAHALFGVGFFLINLLPVLGFITMSYMRITWAADHFLYLPVLGLIGLAAAVAGSMWDSSTEANRKLWAWWGVATFLFLTGLAHRYAGVFANEYEMWTFTLKSNPNAWQAHSRLGKVLLERNDSDGAFYHISESVRLRPDLAETHNNYGAMLEKKGDTQGAIEHLKTAVALAPDIGIYQINLGSLLVRLGRHAEGREVYLRLVKDFPDNPAFLCNLGVAQYFLGETDAAIESFQKALRIKPDLKDAQDNLRQALQKRDGGTSAPQPPAAAPPPPDSGILGTGSAIKLFGP